MWWARLLGGRAVKADDRRARSAPGKSATTRQPVKRVQGNVGDAKAGATAKQAKSGFDPYNSGTFERGNAWERVIRR